jgi:hypothetical protein
MSNDKYTVKLVRGVKPTREWEDATLGRALSRASALAHLHSCEHVYDKATHTFTIDASGYYNK